jgi:hypothetical protein
MWAVRKNPPDLTGQQRTSLAAIAATNTRSTGRICSKSNCAPLLKLLRAGRHRANLLIDSVTGLTPDSMMWVASRVLLCS